MTRNPILNRLPILIVWAVLFCTALPAHAQALTPSEAKTIAEEVYIYGYPLITMEMTRRVMTNVSEVKGTRA